MGFGRPVLHDDPLEEMYGDDSEKEHMTTGVVFLKWVTLRLLINQVNPNGLIHYSELETYGFSSDTKKMLYFIPYDPTIPNQTHYCSMMYFCSRTKYYIPLQGNFLFRIQEFHEHNM